MKCDSGLVLALVVGAAIATFSSQQALGGEESQAGVQASSLTVEPRPTPEIPEGGTAIAARYPGDAGIASDPDVVFVADFEGSVDEICSRWEDVRGKQIMSKSDEVPREAVGGSPSCSPVWPEAPTDTQAAGPPTAGSRTMTEATATTSSIPAST